MLRIHIFRIFGRRMKMMTVLKFELLGQLAGEGEKSPRKGPPIMRRDARSKNFQRLHLLFLKICSRILLPKRAWIKLILLLLDSCMKRAYHSLPQILIIFNRWLIILLLLGLDTSCHLIIL
uniref:Uncharacterized protein LOC105131625 isoform X1 n=1 Tax=Rhizophora mucronata TaxID=61149 RepID=A0A2P2ISS9_RHIMU